MMEINAAISSWRNGGVLLNGPASQGELARLAEFLDAPVPDDLRTLYTVANGMEDNTMDQWHVSFWSIDRLIRERDTMERAGRRWVAFADFLVYSWCFRILPNGDRTAVLAEGTGEEFESVRQFFDRYARDPASLALVRAG
jgi:hypothetical protein